MEIIIFINGKRIHYPILDLVSKRSLNSWERLFQYLFLMASFVKLLMLLGKQTPNNFMSCLNNR